jgi:hypothetical protein
MPNFKLNISYTIDADTEEEAKQFAHIVILEQHIHGSCIPEIGLLREGDRSGANILFKTADDRHYRNQKVQITEYPGFNEALKAYPDND